MSEIIAKDEFIILRELREADIENNIRWNTIDTEWQLWDAPWENENQDLKNWNEYREKELENLKKPKVENRLHSRLQICINDNNKTHIGSVNHYYIDKNYDYTKEKLLSAIGIGIRDSNYWGKGLGTKAFRLYIQYLFENGFTELYTQTWSGNIRMIKVAETLGFKEIQREIGIIEVRGKVYDSLTFRLDKE